MSSSKIKIIGNFYNAYGVNGKMLGRFRRKRDAVQACIRFEHEYNRQRQLLNADPNEKFFNYLLSTIAEINTSVNWI